MKSAFEACADLARPAYEAYRAGLPAHELDNGQEIVLSDLLADLLHLANELGIDPRAVHRRAWSYYMEDYAEFGEALA